MRANPSAIRDGYRIDTPSYGTSVHLRRFTRPALAFSPASPRLP
jgi:hypothetical protein